MFHIGQQVVCIIDFNQMSCCPHVPRVGMVYTIRGFQTAFPPRLGLYLEELVNPECPNTQCPRDGRPGSNEHSFDAIYFRPVKKTDISVFTQILNKTPKELV